MGRSEKVWLLSRQNFDDLKRYNVVVVQTISGSNAKIATVDKVRVSTYFCDTHQAGHVPDSA